MLRQEWKKLFSNKILLVVTAAVIIIPAIYTTLFLGSMWDPYGNVGKLPVAVVNHDRPAVLDGRTLHIGKDLAEELKGNDSLDFCFPSEEDAEKGLETGRYYMVITIPEDFSENAAALTAPSPEKMVLQFKTNPGTNYIASKMGETAMKELKNSIREEVTRSYAQVMIDKAAEAADGVAQAVGGIQNLDAGASSLAGGIAEAGEGGEKLASGTAAADESMVSLSKGLSVLEEKTSGLPAAASALDEGAGALTDGAQSISQGLDTLSSGVSDLQEGADTLSAGLNAVTGEEGARSAQLRSGAAALRDALGAIVSTMSAGDSRSAATADSSAAAAADSGSGDTADIGPADITVSIPGDLSGLIAELSAVQQQAAALSQGIDAYTAGADAAADAGLQLAAGVTQLRAGVDSLKSGMSDLNGGIISLRSGTSSLAESAPALTEGITQAASGAEQIQQQGTLALRRGAADLDNGLGRLGEGAADLKNGTSLLASEAARISSETAVFSDGSREQRDETVDMFAAPLEIEEEQVTYVADNGHAMAPYMMSVGLWVGCIAFCLMYPLTSCPGKPGSGVKWWLSKASVLAVTAVLQAVVMLGALAFFDGFEPERAALTALTACTASVAFMSVMYFFTSLLGRVGSFLMLVFMVVQLAGSAGTYPLEISGSFVPYLHKWVPFTYTVTAFRSTISGGEDISGCLLFLLALTVIFTVLTVLEFRIRAARIGRGDRTLIGWLEAHGLA
ncbi:MAG TPA: YhgE/Pip domain-containing protein [Candidatus Mediterraneibacter tabaqchaliae]|uniref:YhgE/Pip domain-containing protein n=1 Tax=Candidatus Mediterraneibacter tabaqchaliae TaxID=2838689 RepID=A0A9D2R5U4_9FIRM|nr:YhgE/Pip domain-containing protein [Candidatus Mediterraneibacter tabaqchaliae]